MKVALCYSGLVKNFNDCVDSHKKFIIDKFETDIFIHTWSKIGSKTLPNWYNDNYSLDKHIEATESQDSVDIKYFIDHIKIKKILIEYPDIRYFYNKFHDDNNQKFFNNCMMHYSINKANALKTEYESDNNFKYDMVIRCRFDLYFEKLIIENFISNTIYLPPNQNMDVKFDPRMLNLLKTQGFSYMPNDQFAYGCSDSMNYYSSIIDNIKNNFNYYTHHPEGVLSEHLWFKNHSMFKNIEINNNINMRIQSRYWK